ncbi:MAG: aminoacyltransferase [Candidatus Nomurabacteria bacterium]|nr:aminoacyltransferase [Candidatus Nomurabacteria bacterium]
MKTTGVHFLQTEAWARFQRSLGREVITKSGAGWSYLAVVEHGKLARRLYCPYGPTADDEKSLSAALDDLRTEATKRHLDFIRVEPIGDFTEADLRNLGLKRKLSHYAVQPIRTAINDVSGDAATISAGVSQKVRRYARKAERAGLTYSHSQNPADIEFFIEMIHDVAARTGMRPMSDDYYRKMAEVLFPASDAGLIFAEFKGKKIASIVYFKAAQTMYYAHAANFTEYRDLSPANGLGLYALLWAHDQGCQAFDWYGIASERSDTSASLAGITQFKLSFGGTVKDYLGAWELPVNKSKYHLYKLAMKVAKQD